MKEASDLIEMPDFADNMSTFISIANETKTDVRSTLNTINDCFNTVIEYIKGEMESLRSSIITTNKNWHNKYGANNTIFKTIQDTAASYKGFLNGFSQSYAYFSDNYNSTGIPIMTKEQPNYNLYVSFFAYYNGSIILKREQLIVQFPFKYAPQDLAPLFKAPNGTSIDFSGR